MTTFLIPNAERAISAGRRGKITLRRLMFERTPCQHCGHRYAVSNGALEKHEEACPKNPVNKRQSPTKQPCACGRVDRLGHPYMRDLQGGPCWKCLRESAPHPDLDELGDLISRGVEVPRAVPIIVELRGQGLTRKKIAERLSIEVDTIVSLELRYRREFLRLQEAL